jgi:hypothetical protein
MVPPLSVSFLGGEHGTWQIERIVAVTGQALDDAPRLAVVEGPRATTTPAIWALRGITSNERYVERPERRALVARQAPLGRPEATCAALIPISKSPEWWELTQDERRAILEARSRHIEIGLAYLPAVARRLHHGRDLHEEFDFLTWFEFAPAEVGAFEELVGRLRETEEWAYVEREVDIRVTR